MDMMKKEMHSTVWIMMRCTMCRWGGNGQGEDELGGGVLVIFWISSWFYHFKSFVEIKLKFEMIRDLEVNV